MKNIHKENKPLTSIEKDIVDSVNKETPTSSDHSNKKMLSFSIIIFASISIPLIIWGVNKRENMDLRKKAADNKISLSFDTDRIEIDSGYKTITHITIDTKENKVSGVELHLTYDADKVEIVNITPGNFLPIVLKNASFGNNKAIVTLGSKPNNPPKGTAVLATITLKGKSVSDSIVTIDNDTKVAMIGSNENAFGSSGSLKIVTHQATQTPTPEPSYFQVPLKIQFPGMK